MRAWLVIAILLAGCSGPGEPALDSEPSEPVDDGHHPRTGGGAVVIDCDNRTLPEIWYGGDGVLSCVRTGGTSAGGGFPLIGAEDRYDANQATIGAPAGADVTLRMMVFCNPSPCLLDLEIQVMADDVVIAEWQHQDSPVLGEEWYDFAATLADDLDAGAFLTLSIRDHGQSPLAFYGQGGDWGPTLTIG